MPRIDTSFAAQVHQLYAQCQIEPTEGSALLLGLGGQSRIDDLPLTVRISPMRQSRYQGGTRVGASTLGYRQIVEIHSGGPVKFSVVHRGISGSWLIKWVNRLKGIHRVPHVVTDLYGYDVWCSKPDWAIQFLNNTEANVAITRLLASAESDAALGHPCLFMTANRVSHFRRGKTLPSFSELRSDLDNLALVTKVAQALWRT